MMTVMAVMAMTLQAQENNYIVKTKQAIKTAKVSTPEVEAAEEQEEEPKDFLEKSLQEARKNIEKG